jgi:hypothetical protein
MRKIKPDLGPIADALREQIDFDVALRACIDIAQYDEEPLATTPLLLAKVVDAAANGHDKSSLLRKSFKVKRESSSIDTISIRLQDWRKSTNALQTKIATILFKNQERMKTLRCSAAFSGSIREDFLNNAAQDLKRTHSPERTATDMEREAYLPSPRKSKSQCRVDEETEGEYTGYTYIRDISGGPYQTAFHKSTEYNIADTMINFPEKWTDSKRKLFLDFAVMDASFEVNYHNYYTLLEGAKVLCWPFLTRYVDIWLQTVAQCNTCRSFEYVVTCYEFDLFESSKVHAAYVEDHAEAFLTSDWNAKLVKTEKGAALMTKLIRLALPPKPIALKTEIIEISDSE